MPPVLAQLVLFQSGNTIPAWTPSGKSEITMLGATIGIEGSVSDTGHLLFKSIYYPKGCGTLTGDFQVSGVSMSGTLELNSIPCVGLLFTGNATLTRNASTMGFDLPRSGEERNLQSALRALSGSE